MRASFPTLAGSFPRLPDCLLVFAASVAGGWFDGVVWWMIVGWGCRDYKFHGYPGGPLIDLWLTHRSAAAISSHPSRRGLRGQHVAPVRLTLVHIWSFQHASLACIKPPLSIQHADGNRRLARRPASGHIWPVDPPPDFIVGDDIRTATDRPRR